MDIPKEFLSKEFLSQLAVPRDRQGEFEPVVVLNMKAEDSLLNGWLSRYMLRV